MLLDRLTDPVRVEIPTPFPIEQLRHMLAGSHFLSPVD